MGKVRPSPLLCFILGAGFPLAVLVGPPAPPAPPAAGLTIEAWDFDGGNVRVSRPGQPYADGPSCIWHGADSPDQVEYVVEIPLGGDFTLSAQYAAKQSRPVQILLDGKQVHTGLSGETGSWQTRSAAWEKQCRLRLTPGRHTLALERDGPLPHICALRLEATAPRPPGASVRRLSPEERVNRARLRERQALVQARLDALRRVDVEAVGLAIDDLERTFPGRYDAPRHRRALAEYARLASALRAALDQGQLPPLSPELNSAQAALREAMLANPLLDSGTLLVVRRDFPGTAARQVGAGESAGFVAANYQSHASLRTRTGWRNEIAVITRLRETPQFRTLHPSREGRILRDVRLDFDARKLLFSSIDDQGRWAVFELPSSGGTARQITPSGYPDVDFFDACYLPDGRIVVASTASYQGVPCTSGKDHVAALYLLDPRSGSLRQLTFDQDHGNDPVVLHDGRVLYQRWEYSDIPHYFSRRRASMNPDGTGQLALHGSGSWFPTAFRFARPVPGHPTLLAGIISGHHDYGDCGRLALLDPGLAGAYPFRLRPESLDWGAAGQHVALAPDVLPAEQTGFVQLIPGRGQPVAGTVCDDVVRGFYLKQRPELMTHPHPLSSKYFLVSMKPGPSGLWGIYLADVFDNLTLIAEAEGSALFEPILFQPRPSPPVIPDRVDLASQTATVHIGDVYAGPGLQGVPRGTVKSLRVFAYHFGYRDRASFELIGTQSGWDVKRILGIAAVEEDGSADFVIPANTPVSLQPLDAEGRALQLMRSWLVGMPGERVSCAGCHENRAETIAPRQTLSLRQPPRSLTPWLGPARPFDFALEVFPVLQRHCAGCHEEPARVGPRSHPCFREPDLAYDSLHPYVHRPGPEADMALLNPLEYHASTSPLIQMLEKGHHGLRLDDLPQESRQRLYAWIDLNTPRHGSFRLPESQQFMAKRRSELSQTFAGHGTDAEEEARRGADALRQAPPATCDPPPEEAPTAPDNLRASGFPFDAAQASARQRQGPEGGCKTVPLGNGVVLALRWIPAGEFVMGSLEGAPDERPRARVRIAEPFWMAETEISNAQYGRFDPAHDTRYIDMHYMDRVTPGYIANHPDQPVARVSWEEAMAFCGWLSAQTGLRVTLPTEAQWEWAARAGTETPFFFGTLEDDWSRFANLADRSLRWFKMGYPGPGKLQPRLPYPEGNNFPLRDERFQDRCHVVDATGRTEPNPWGLRDLIGNVSEWTRTSYWAYPYAEEDGRNGSRAGERKVARGGSWADRPADAGASVRRAFASWQKVYNVGFRVILQPASTPGKAS